MADLKKTDEATAAAPAPEPKPLPKVRINAICARIAATCMAKMNIRYYLNGLYVEPRKEGGVVIVGTDGHRLCAVIDKDGEASESVILRMSSLVMKLPKPGAKANRNEMREPDQFTVELEAMSNGKPVLALKDNLGRFVALAGDAIVEGKFPDWRRVVPSDWTAIKPQCLNLYRNEYVQDTVTLLQNRRSPHAVRPTCFQEKKDGQMLWHISGFEHVLLVVMPLHDDYGGPSDPQEWKAHFWPGQFKALAKPAKAKKAKATAAA